MTEIQSGKPLTHLLLPVVEKLKKIPEEKRATSPLWALRQKGLDTFLRTGIPTPRDEEWKYLNLSPFLQHAYELATPPSSTELPNHLLELLQQSPYRIVLINGYYSKELSTLPEGITIQSYRKVFEQLGGNGLDTQIFQYLGKALAPDTDAFVALNSALFDDGVFLYIPESYQSPAPLSLINISFSPHPLFVNLRTTIVLEQNARLQLVFHQLVNGEHPVFHNWVTEIFQKPNSQLETVFLQIDQDKNFGVYTTTDEQEHGSRSAFYTVSVGNGLARNTLSITLKEKESQTHLYGVAALKDSETVDNHTEIRHIAPNCESNELYKVIVGESARSIFNGKIYVAPDAQQTNAYQSNHSILLSDNAQAYAKPQLEIYADDVKCTHGATFGQLSGEATFYLRSRGLSQAIAEALLLHAFAAECYEDLPMDQIHSLIDSVIWERIMHMIGLQNQQKLLDLQDQYLSVAEDA